jgi:L-threonylcarbamoyladenylate synthase
MIVPADLAGLHHALEVLAADGLVAFPTESYYGLAARADSQLALDRLLAAKLRRADVPLACVAHERAVASRLWDGLPDLADRLIRRHWPGPLTIVCPARPGLPAALVGPAGAGVRVSAHPVVEALCGLAVARFPGIGACLTATSANLSGQPAQRSAAAVRATLPVELVELVLDGGQTAGGPPSTVVEVLASGKARVVRSGAVILDDLELA